MRKKLIFGFILCLSFLSLIYPEINVIEEPEPLYHGISNAITIKLIKSIEEIDDDNLRAFAGILAADTDRDGNYYIFDYKHGTIVKLNSRFKFVTTIGRKGEGPGEFKISQASPVKITVGLDNKLYFSSLMNRKIIKFTVEGKYIDEHKLENFRPFKAVADKSGNIYLPSIREHIFDVYDNKMKFKRTLLSNSIRSSFLFFKPPACVIHKQSIPYYWNIRYVFLSSGDILLLNNLDISAMIINKDSGKIKKKFYLWADYVLSEYRIKIKETLEDVKKGLAACAYSAAFSCIFIDRCDDIYLKFVDTKYNCYIYKFSSSGKLIQVYKIEHPQSPGLIFFKYSDNKYYAFSRYGIHIFSE